MDTSLAIKLLERLYHLDLEKRPWYDKIRGTHVLIEHYIQEVLEEEKIHFTTLFTKLAYLCLKYKTSKRTSFFSHLHRKNMELLDEVNADQEKYLMARYTMIALVSEIGNIDLPDYILAIFKVPNVKFESTTTYASKLQFARVHIFDIIKDDHILVGFNEKIPEENIYIKLNVIGKNDDYNSLIRFIQRRKKFPITLHLENIEILEDGTYVPLRIVFEPDYLIDVTSISECFKPGESSPLFYFIKKFFPVFQNKYLIIGNVANYFLDELFHNPKASFQELIKNTFSISPLGFSLMNDEELKEVVATLKKHYHTILKTIQDQLPIHSIDRDNTFLEPSFYAPKYGIQGRLDLFSRNNADSTAKIIELKSGKPYKANSYGLNINHYVQTLLYDLMVNAVHEHSLKTSSFILYSSQPDDALRFAPPLRIQQKEAIKLRNQLVEIDYLLADVDTDNDSIFSYVNPEYIKSAGFAKRDLEAFRKTYTSASTLARNYFNAFTAFVAREQILSKTGEFGMDKSSGLAGLWLDDVREKVDNFRMLNALEFASLNVENDHTLMTFKRTSKTATNANFRRGDLGVLYPFTSGNHSAIKNQIFKCSIIHIDPSKVTVRLRNRQSNTSLFESELKWHIEHDHLDHGFNAMYQDLFRFLSAERSYQEIILGRQKPAKALENQSVAAFPSHLTTEQQSMLHEMINASQYYLLWGPPGTGKTSVMLHQYLKYKYENTQETTLVIAYTNKAVDEICDAITRIGGKINQHYIRIGSRYSTNAKFVNNLLVSKLDDITKRAELLEVFAETRIVVSTLASIHGKKEIFSLLNIDSIVVDEASQILEPQLVGFLSLAKKFILVGDHNQLPAIVLQREDESKVEEERLNAIGLSDRRNSLFERLYRRCEAMNWGWAIGKLTHQGRMHEQIMEFANLHFYKDQLKGIQSIPRIFETSPYLKDLASAKIPMTSRMIYIPTDIDQDTLTFKTNQDEANKSAIIIKSILHNMRSSALEFNSEKIGIITPYRAQISAILAALHKSEVEEEISVDTVERYQGGARDIIIISICLNLASQLRQLVSLSTDGIDRKLNVAMTRAREQVIILGNEELLRKNETYSALLDTCTRVEL